MAVGGVVAEESARAKEGDDVLAVNGGGAGSLAAYGVNLFQLFGWRLPLPEQFACLAGQGHRVKALVAHCSQIDAVLKDHGRGMPWRQIDFPDHICFGANLSRQFDAVGGDPYRVGAAELGPVLCGSPPGRQQTRKTEETRQNEKP